MKKIIAIFLCLITSVSIANPTVDIILPTKSAGTAYDVISELKPLLEKQGYNVNMIMSGVCIKAQHDFYATKNPTALFLFNAYSSFPECSKSAPSNTSWVSSLTTSPIMICGKPGKDNLGILQRKESSTIASTSSYSPNIVKSLNPNFKYVPYAESGETARGFIAGDTEFIITNMLRATKLMKDGLADCVTVSGNDNIQGVVAATKLFPNWKYNAIEQQYGMIYRNMNPAEAEQFKKAVKTALASAEWKAFADRNGYILKPNITPEAYNNSSKLWSRD